VPGVDSPFITFNPPKYITKENPIVPITSIMGLLIADAAIPLMAYLNKLLFLSLNLTFSDVSVTKAFITRIPEKPHLVN